MNDAVEHVDSAAVRGMIDAVSHLLAVEEA
jgi:ribosomal protein L30/L7E